MSAKRATLQLRNLDRRHPGLTPAVAATYCEAAAVCLSKHHEPPKDARVTNNEDKSTTPLDWDPPAQRTLDAWANDTDATEAGAYACVLAAVEMTKRLVAVRRAETRTGADYYVAPYGASAQDLEECYRLEVSGSDAVTEKALHARLRQKLEQAANGASNLPAIAGVVCFKELLILIEDLQES